MSSSTVAGYEPMPLQAGWVLERHLGWRVVCAERHLKVLRLPRGPFSRTLVLARGQSGGAIESAVRDAHGLRAGAITVVDFDDASNEPVRNWAGVAFALVQGPRWFGVGTFVVDLEPAEEELLARMAARERQACRRPREVEAAVAVDERPGPERLVEFLELYEPMARARGLEVPQLQTLRRMADMGDLWAARVADDQGAAVMNLVYARHPSAWYLYGARRPGSPGWAGAVSQWRTISALKRAGYKWYDLGLVASRDPEDGIQRFKSGLGGQFVSSGSEYLHEPALFVAARRLAGWVRRTGGKG